MLLLEFLLIVTLTGSTFTLPGSTLDFDTENTLLLYSLAVVWFVILIFVFPGISVNWNAPFKPF